jgi:hypothetical protein
MLTSNREVFAGNGMETSTSSRYILLHVFPAPEVAEPWRQFLARIEQPAHYNAPEFFLEPHWENRQPFAVLAFQANKVTGVVTGIHEGNHLVCGVQSRPQVCFDKSVDQVSTSESLIRGLLEEAGGAKRITVFSWNWNPLPEFERHGYRRRDLEGTVVLDLRRGRDTLYKDSHENRKRNIKIALKQGIEVVAEQTPEDVAGYWEVYSAWRKTDRKVIHHNLSRDAIEKIHTLSGNNRRFLARYQGKVIAATGLRFFPGGLIEYANNCSYDEYMQLRPNDLLIWRTIEWACEKGFSAYSLGAAHPFLRKSGGSVVPIYRYSLDRTFLHYDDLKENLLNKARVLRRLLSARLKTK